MVFVDRRQFNQHYTELTDPGVTSYIREQYQLSENDHLLLENKDYPIILGSVTRFNTCSMSSVATFNMCLDQSTKKDNLMRLMTFANGVDDEIGEELNKANCKDWRDRFFDNLPYPAEDTVLVGLP